MGLLSTVSKKRGKTLTVRQIEQIEKRIQETKKKYPIITKPIVSGKNTNSNKQVLSLKSEKKIIPKFVKTGIEGFDKLMEKGIPRSASILVAGGAGSGKTIFCMQTLFNAAKKGEKCLYLSFEESEERLKEHMTDFGWEWKKLEEKGLLKIIS